MLKTKEERYEFDFTEQINAGGKEGLKAIVFDVVPVSEKECMMTGIKKGHLIIQSEEKDLGKEKDGEEMSGHTPFGFIEFVDESNLALAQQGLELIQRAIFDDSELREELEENNEVK